MRDGYTHCDCADCFEIAIGPSHCDDCFDDHDPADCHAPILCNACEEAGCDPDHDRECSAPHTYCDEGSEPVMVGGKEYCGDCGQAF